jgi:hypothetical protein
VGNEVYLGTGFLPELSDIDVAEGNPFVVHSGGKVELHSQSDGIEQTDVNNNKLGKEVG